MFARDLEMGAKNDLNAISAKFERRGGENAPTKLAKTKTPILKTNSAKKLQASKKIIRVF
ncbi:MAG: hypothetical protein LBU73_05460 [Helicobacteraceae bacterium]|jgi:hypothetical protein|nr:hypothetical protein [Helicobacteraceae bacterium]